MSQLAGQSPFQTVAVSQRMPSALDFKDSLETASVVVGRQSAVSYPATNGGPYTVGQGQSEISIPLSANGYLDLQTVCLSYEVELGGNTTTNVTNQPVLEPGPFSVFSEMILEVGGVQISRIRDPGSVYTAYAYAGQIQSHDNSEGTIENSWATSQKATTTVAGASDETLTDKLQNLQNPTQLTSLGDLNGQTGIYSGTNNGVGQTAADLGYRNSNRNGIKKIVVPLSKIMGFFQMENYMPLGAVGNITLRLRTQSKVESCVVCQQAAAQGTQALVSGASVSLNDVRVIADIVKPESAYESAMNQLLASATGLNFSFTDTEVQVRDYTGTASGVSEYNLNFVLGSRYLTRCLFLLRHRASLNSPNQCSTFSFGSQGFQQARLQLGSLSVPSATFINSIEDAYYNLLKANNMQGNPDYGNAISLKEYCADIYRTGRAGGDEIASPSKFILGFSLEQVLQSDPSLLQGINTLQFNSNVQLIVDLVGGAKIFGAVGDEADLNCQATGIFNMVKVLSIKMNSVAVESK